MSDDDGEYEGIPCPVPNCEGYLRWADPNDKDSTGVMCEFGHLAEWVL